MDERMAGAIDGAHLFVVISDLNHKSDAPVRRSRLLRMVVILCGSEDGGVGNSCRVSVVSEDPAQPAENSRPMWVNLVGGMITEACLAEQKDCTRDYFAA